MPAGEVFVRDGAHGWLAFDRGAREDVARLLVDSPWSRRSSTGRSHPGFDSWSRARHYRQLAGLSRCPRVEEQGARAKDRCLLLIGFWIISSELQWLPPTSRLRNCPLSFPLHPPPPFQHFVAYSRHSHVSALAALSIPLSNFQHCPYPFPTLSI
jgi:hypothetical protein